MGGRPNYPDVPGAKEYAITRLDPPSDVLDGNFILLPEVVFERCVGLRRDVLACFFQQSADETAKQDKNWTKQTTIRTRQRAETSYHII